MSRDELWAALAEAREDLRFAQDEYDDTVAALGKGPQGEMLPGLRAAWRFDVVGEPLRSNPQFLAVDEQLREAQAYVAAVESAYERRCDSDRDWIVVDGDLDPPSPVPRRVTSLDQLRESYR